MIERDVDIAKPRSDNLPDASDVRFAKQRNYEKDVYPNPSRYFVKDFLGYTAVYPEIEVILPKYSRLAYTTKNTTPEEFRYISANCVEQHLIQKLTSHLQGPSKRDKKQMTKHWRDMC